MPYINEAGLWHWLCGESWHAAFDGGDGHGLRLREHVSARTHQPGDSPGGRNALKLFVSDPFSATAAGRPFPHNAQRTAKAAGPHTPPELCTIAAPARPEGLEQWPVCLETALTLAEDIASATSQDLSDRSAAQTRLPDDLFDRDAESVEPDRLT